MLVKWNDFAASESRSVAVRLYGDYLFGADYNENGWCVILHACLHKTKRAESNHRSRKLIVSTVCLTRSMWKFKVVVGVRPLIENVDNLEEILVSV